MKCYLYCFIEPMVMLKKKYTLLISTLVIVVVGILAFLYIQNSRLDKAEIDSEPTTATASTDKLYAIVKSGTIMVETLLPPTNWTQSKQKYTINKQQNWSQTNNSQNYVIDLPNSSSEWIINKKLIASWYIDGTWSIKSNLTGFLVGHDKIRTRDSMWKILAPVIMQSSGNKYKIEVQIPAGTIVKDAKNNVFTWIINTPEVRDIETIPLPSPVFAAIFWSTWERINFENTGNVPVNVTIRMPAPEKDQWDIVQIYYSQDNGNTWNFHSNNKVDLINGEPYVEFTTTHFTIFAIWGTTWDNHNFINDSFWRASPTDTQIKEAIFGNSGDTKTAYTQERSSNVCSTWTINIVNVQNYTVSWINSLPQLLAANTIYVLNSGTYITSGQIIYNGNCIAVIGKWETKIYSNISLSWSASISAMFKSKDKNNVILSDVKIDWLQDGLGTYRYNGQTSSGNGYWIYFYNTKYGSIHNISAYNNRYWIQLEIDEGVVVSNSLFYNNWVYGGQILSSPNTNYFINNQVFNNTNVWFYVGNSTWQIITNSQFYNNKFQWLVLNNSKNNIISNCMSYNNSPYWLRLQSNSSNNVINNSWFFNNSNTWFFVESGLDNTYYWSIKLFNNSNNSSANTLVWWISAWSSWDTLISWLWRNDGTVDTWLSVWYPYITNPRTNDGRELISWSARSTTNRSNKTRTWIEFINFTYGTWIIKQIPNITYGITTLSLSNLSYDTNKYIAQINYTNTNPDGFTFTNVTWASLNQLYTSNTITLTWMDSGVFEYVTINWRGTIFKNWVDIWTWWTWSNGDQFAIQMTSSSNYYTLRSGSLVVWTTFSDFTITTVEQIIDNVPDDFTFTDVTWANVNQIYTSNIITLTGMDPAAEISMILSWRGTLFKNWVDIGNSGTWANEDKFTIQITSSSNYNTLRHGILIANSVSASFGVTTQPDLIFPTFSGVISWTTYSEPLSITFSDDNLSWATLNGNPYTSWTTISAEWDYVFEVSDTAWNITWASFRISIPKTITITFDAPISTWIVTKAPIKYNKDVAYSFTYDDGIIDWYQPVFKYSEWWQIVWWGSDFVAPWLYYTDGAGNDIAFKWAYARYSLNSTFGDKHVNTPSSITRSQLAETYSNWWNVLNHTLRHETSPITGELINYPDNPPGTTGMDYSYEILKNDTYVRDHIGISWVSLTHFVAPSGDLDYIQPARDLWYKSMAHQGYSTWTNWLDVYNPINLYHLMMHRKYFTSQTYDTSNITNDIDALMASWSAPTTKLWRQASTHWVPLTGTVNGWMDFALWQYLMDSIANNYGKKWTDKIRVAWSQEVYEYLATKQWTNVLTTVSWNQLIITLDTLDVPTDLRTEALSLLVTWTNATITSIEYQNGAFTYHSENKTGWLINLEMGDYYPTDRNPDAFDAWNITNANRWQLYTWNTITLTWMSFGLENIIYLSWAGTLYKNWNNIWTSGTGTNGDQFHVTLLSSNNVWTTTSTLVNIWLQSQTYSITTSNETNSVPNTFTFIDKTWGNINTLYTSNIITLSWMSSGVSTGISVNAGYILKNGINIGQSWTGWNDDQFVLALTSSNSYSTTVHATMTIAGISDIFSITTQNPPPAPWFSWNNDNFINDSFWRANPTDTQIKEAIFGNSGDINTAYTQERSSNVCSTWTINIVNVQNYAVSGINSLPQLLAANTIYVLNSGTYITSGQIYYNGNCSAVIGKSTTKIYSSVALESWAASTCIFKSTSKDNIILSDIKIDWLQDWLGNYRYAGNLSSGNSYGVYFYNMKNGSIHAVSMYNNRVWLQVETAENVVVTEMLSYNNGVYGLQIVNNAKTNHINNSQIFNNNSVWLYITNSTGTIIHNVQTYNNKFQWMVLSRANNSIISNCMSYNNNRYWLRFQSNSSNNVINNSWFFNNSTTGVFVESWIWNTYYGNIKIFNNASSSSANTLVWWITAWTSWDTLVSWLWRNDGTVDTWLSVWYPYITNPRTNDGRDLISWSARSTTNRSSKTRTWIEFVSFTYGTWISKQAKNISYTTPSLWLSNLPYDSNKYIAQINYTNTNPDSFSFTALTWTDLHTVYTSNTITLAWMDTWTWEYVTINWRGTIFKNWVDIWTWWTWSNGDQFAIQMTSSSNYYTLRSGSLVVWTTFSDFTITTVEQIIDNVPDEFTFTDVTWADLNHIYTSNIITLTGMDPAAEISMIFSWRGTIFKNWVNIGYSGTWSNGDQFAIQMTSSSNNNTQRYALLLANSVSALFGVTTQPDLIFPTFSGVISWTTYSEPLSITFSDDNLSWATLNGNPYTSWTTISAEWDYVFEVSDTAWNITWASFRISIPKTITITFDAPISTWTIIKAPIKYNKDVAYGMVYDDGLDDWYQPAFKYMAWWQISWWNVNFISPWLYYTDGAGNDIAFKWWYAWYSVNSAFNDLHLTTPSYIKWTELKETYLDWWDIINHWRSSAAYPTSGQIYNYPENPPWSTWLDYGYEIRKGYEYVRDRIGLSWVSLTHFILPSWDPWYTQPARDQWYKSVSAQWIGIWANWINISPTVDLYHFQMNRKYTTSQNSDLSNVTNDIDTLMANSSGATTKLWRHAFTHGVVFTGNNNGWMDFSLWKYLMDHMADTYGKNWSDKVRVAGPQEVYEYVATKQWTNVTTIVSGNQMIVNLDTLSVPTDLRREALSLLVTWTNAQISSIEYQNGAFTYHSENKTGWLINLEMGDYYPTDRNPDAFNLWSQTNATTWSLYTSNTITLSWMSSWLNNIIYLSWAGTLYKNWSNVWSSSTGKNGDQFSVKLNASTNTSTTVSTIVKIWLQTQIYSITTQAQATESDDIIDLPSSSSESVMNTRLIASWYNSWIWSIISKSNAEWFLIWTKRIRTRDSMWKILAPVIMQSSGNNNVIEAQIPAWTVVKDANDNIYTWVIDIPQAVVINTWPFSDTISVASFWSNSGSINFEDTNGNPVNITIRMPAPWRFYGELVNIYSSQDNWFTRTLHTNTTIVNIWWQPYVEFTTTHATDFLIDWPLGWDWDWWFFWSFNINSGAATTISTGVTLYTYISIPIAKIRVSNSGSSWTPWVSFTWSSPWSLTQGYWLKTVNAQYDILWEWNSDFALSDNIEYVWPGSMPPKVWAWYISVWTTWYSTAHWSYYYKWDVTIAATVDDPDSSLSWSTCEYTIDWTHWISANFHTTYCDAFVTEWHDLAIQFRISDVGGNVGTWDKGTYFYDTLPPVVSWTGNTYVWATKWWWAASDASRWIAVDSEWNKYMVGYFADTGTFWSINVISDGWYDAFLTKISPSGEYLWAIKWWSTATNSFDFANWVRVDAWWNIYVVGSFYWTGNFWSFTLTGGGWFIAKVSNNGTYLRVKKSWSSTSSVDIDNEWNIYTDWTLNWTWYFWSITLTGGTSFVAKMTSAGTYLWASKWSWGAYNITSIAVDDQWNSYMVGGLSSTWYFWSIVTNGVDAGVDPFITKISPTGEFLRVRKGDGYGKDYGYWVAVDSGWNSYMVGGLGWYTWTFWSIVLTGNQPFIAKLSPTGDFLRVKWSDSSAAYAAAQSIVLDDIWNSYVVGGFGWSITFWSTTLTTSNTYYDNDTFLTKLSPTGEFLRAAKWGWIGSDYAYWVALDASWNSYIAWAFSQSATFWLISLTSYGSTDAFIAKWSEYAWSGLFTINNDAIYTTGIDVTLNIHCPIDDWVWWEQISYGHTTGSYEPWTWCDATKPWKLESGDGTKIVYMRTKDSLGNISEDYSDTIILDSTSPIVNKAYISSWTTWYNSPDLYYKWTIDIKGNVSDTWWLNTGLCYYTTGESRLLAAYSWTSTTWYCYATWITYSSDLYLMFKIFDTAGNLWAWDIWRYMYDWFWPSNVVLLSPISWSTLNTWTVNLLWSWSVDTWVWMSWYTYQIASDIAFSNIILSGNTINTWITLLNLSNDTYYRRVSSYDMFNNSSSRSTIRNFNIVLETNAPIVGQAYISNWTTGIEFWTNYYKWTIDIRADVSDTNRIDPASCQYTLNGVLWGDALYAGTNTTWYCYVLGINPSADLNIRFRVKNDANNTTIGATWTYIYDATGPVGWVVNINNSAPSSNTWIVNLYITACPSDVWGIWLSWVYIGNTPSTMTTFYAWCPNTITSRELEAWNWIRTVYIKSIDKLWNIWNIFTGSISVNSQSTSTTFTINNNATSTTSSWVTLNISTSPTATRMRFSDDETMWSTRETYATSKARTLPGSYGTKYVYAQFDTDNNTNTIEGSGSDSILYSTWDGGRLCAAWSYCGDLRLRIITGHSYCQYGTTLDFGTTGLSYSGRSLITWFVATGGNPEWFCEDQQWLGTRALTIQSSDLVNISTNVAAQTIPASRVFIKNPAAYIPQWEWVCTFSSGDSLNQRVNLSWAKEILGKVGTVGEGCKIITDNLSLKVDLIAAQAIGQYSGTLTINVPNF